MTVRVRVLTPHRDSSGRKTLSDAARRAIKHGASVKQFTARELSRLITSRVQVPVAGADPPPSAAAPADPLFTTPPRKERTKRDTPTSEERKVTPPTQLAPPTLQAVASTQSLGHTLDLRGPRARPTGTRASPCTPRDDGQAQLQRSSLHRAHQVGLHGATVLQEVLLPQRQARLLGARARSADARRILMLYAYRLCTLLVALACPLAYRRVHWRLRLVCSSEASD